MKFQKVGLCIYISPSPHENNASKNKHMQSFLCGFVVFIQAYLDWFIAVGPIRISKVTSWGYQKSEAVLKKKIVEKGEGSVKRDDVQYIQSGGEKEVSVGKKYSCFNILFGSWQSMSPCSSSFQPLKIKKKSRAREFPHEARPKSKGFPLT